MAEAHNGDKGKTLLSTPTPISKDDIRLEAIGSLEELIAILRLSAIPGAGPHCPTLLGMVSVLSGIREYIRMGGRAVMAPKGEAIAALEERIAKLATPSEPSGIALTEASARAYHAAAVARRTERAVVHAARVYPVAETVIAYLNRLSDFLSALGRYTDYESERVAPQEAGEPAPKVAPAPAVTPEKEAEGLVRAVLSQMGEKPMIELSEAKRLCEEIEKHAAKEGRRVVIAVTNTAGNPIAVHVMDGAYLVSFDVAIKKAYSAVAVKMPTVELGKLVADGATFQGLDRITDLCTFGGGVPLYRGNILAGGLGISGGTGEEDHALCEYALSVFAGM